VTFADKALATLSANRTGDSGEAHYLVRFSMANVVPSIRVLCDYCDRLATGAMTGGERASRLFSCDAHRADMRSHRPALSGRPRWEQFDFDDQVFPAIREQYPEAVRDRLVPGVVAEWVHRVRSDDMYPRREWVTLVAASEKTATIRLQSGQTKRVPLVKLANIGRTPETAV
jgi:hypothetical protein